MSPAVELRDFLAAEGVGTVAATSGWSLSATLEPAGPDTVITLYDTPGPAPVSYAIELRQQGVQVRVRAPANDYAGAYAKQVEAFRALNSITNQVIGQGFYLGVRLVGDIQSLGRDDNDRHLLVANYQIQRGPAP